MSKRREWMLAAALAAVALLIIVASAPDDRQFGDFRPSTFLATETGAMALYLMLEELGLPVEHGLSRWTGEGPDASALALIAPTIPPAPEELDALTAWIEAGGTLLYVAHHGDPTLAALGLDALVAADTSATPTAATALPEPHRWTEGVYAVHGFRDVFGDSAAALHTDGAVPLLRLADGGVAAVILRRGAGTVIAWSDVAPLQNDALRTSGAALVLARLVAEATADGQPLVFDEIHHGFRGDGHAIAGTLRFLRERPAGHASLQLLAVVLVLLIAAGWRFGAPLLPAPAQRRSPLEHVDALAKLYQQANARHTTRRLLLAQLARRLGRRPPPVTGAHSPATRATDEPGTTSTPSIGADPADTDDMIDPILAGLRVDPASIETIRTEWRRGRRGELATLTKAMDRLVNEVRRS